jgi:pyruvate,water dikinase
MASLKRNRHLEALAAGVRDVPGAADDLRRGRMDNLPASLRSSLDTFVAQYGTLSSGITGDAEGALAESTLVRLILELAARPGPSPARQSVDHEALVRRFIDAFSPEERDWAQSLLDLARSSYRLRDDDNIHLGRIEAQARRAVREAAARLANDPTTEDAVVLREALSLMPPAKPAPTETAEKTAHGSGLQARQLVGQPAGPGLARGRARVVTAPQDLKAFQSGEILICDAVDPNMTFVVPLAAAVVERRGGMLIHGAIIAREYGLPCVTGVPEALQFIRSGDHVTVDGYLGIVIISPANT